MIERLAEWYLKRRGRAVLPRCFVGLAVGAGLAVRKRESSGFSQWEVEIPSSGKLWALNNSMILESMALSEPPNNSPPRTA
jgi:hypothetical protein